MDRGKLEGEDATMKDGYFDVLPDGRRFAFWDCETAFGKTYHVSQRHPKASDDNPGTEDKPFVTIGRAAEILEIPPLESSRDDRASK